MSERVLDLGRLALESVCAHGGEGRIAYRRLFEGRELEGAWNFIDYAVVPPGASIGRHTHGEDEELYLVLEGRGTMWLEGREFPVQAGSLVLNPRGGTHALRNDSDAPLRLFVVEVACRSGGARHG